MHSPKFPGKAADIRKIVDAKKLRKLWQSSVRDHLRRQLLPDPAEFLDFHVAIKQRCADLENAVCSGEYIPGRVIRLRSEKSKGLCRQLVMPSPADALVLQALSDTLWKEISPKSPSTNSFYAPQDQPFAKQSPKAAENEFGYGPLEAWLDFQETILGFSKSRRFIVVTDVANYYDFIIHNYLRAILAEYAGEKEHALDLLLYVLDSMLWRPDYMPNYGIGMPQMDLDAPRLLAHTHLFEIDALFSGGANVDFARYMDDMDFGVDSIAQAKLVLRDLDLALQTRNLRLNSGKTKILTAIEAQRHFRLEDNARFERVQERLHSYPLGSTRRVRFGNRINKTVAKRVADGYFDAGNGDKVLKRLVTLLTREKISLKPDTFRKLLYNKPSMREAVLRNWSLSGQILNNLPIIAGFLLSGEAVDDVSKIWIATHLVNAQSLIPLNPKEFDFLLSGLSKTDHVDLYCRIWLLSRFATAIALKSEIDSTNTIWSRHKHLSRLVAGLYGLFRYTALVSSFEPFVRKWGGVEAALMLDFQESLFSTSAGYKSVATFIKAANTSLPNQTTHSKMLMLATMLMNPAIPKVDRAKLLGANARMMADVYYRDLFSTVITAAP